MCLSVIIETKRGHDHKIPRGGITGCELLSMGVVNQTQVSEVAASSSVC